MSLCHPSLGSVSCGACCGLFNLKLDVKGYKNLLTERTNYFKSSVKFEIRHTVAAFRQTRESIESTYTKNDEMTYNCPYLGYVDEAQSRIGCMIHPVFTGDPKSQNFSFYGTSICQAYDCKNKENIATDLIEDLIRKVSNDSIEFSHLASDHILIYLLESWLGLKGWSLSEGIQVFEKMVLDVLKSRLKKMENFYPTSFEIRYSNVKSESEVYDSLSHMLNVEDQERILTEMKKAPARE